MITTPQTVADFIGLAREAILAKDFDAAETYKKQAEALKSVDDLDRRPPIDTSQRLPFPAQPAGDAVKTAQMIALDAWYSKTWGGASLDADTALVMGDLYGNDYKQLNWAKSRDFLRYVATGRCDDKLRTMALYSPNEVMKALTDGMDFAGIKATQVESQDWAGGYLVPPDIQNRLIMRLQGLTPMRSIADSMTTMSDRVTVPVVTGGDDQYPGAVRVFKVDESPVGTEAATNATYGNITVPVHTIMGHVAVSKNVLEDTTGATSIATNLENQLAAGYKIFEDTQFSTGNGVGGPQGILQNNGTGGPFTFTYGSIQSVNSGQATALTGDGIRNVPFAVATQYRMNGGMWLMSRGSVRTIRTLKTGAGDYLWADRDQQLQNGQPPQLEGFPIRETETLASPTSTSVTTYTANVYPIIFVTRGAYLIVDKAGGLDVTRYDDSTTAKSNQIVLVMRKRVGGQVVLPWGIAVQKVSA